MAETVLPTFLKGVQQFNRGQFFDAHETWEILWMAASGPDRMFLQGAIQIAAAFHHWGRGNPAGTRSLLTAGLAKLVQFPAIYHGIRVDCLREQLQAWLQAVGSDLRSDRLSLPQIEWASR